MNAYKEGGILPKWASPGYRGERLCYDITSAMIESSVTGAMTGTMGDVALADAIVKNITGFDVATAYAAIRQVSKSQR